MAHGLVDNTLRRQGVSPASLRAVSTRIRRLLNSATYGNLKRTINVSIVSMVLYVATAFLAGNIEKKILSYKRDSSRTTKLKVGRYLESVRSDQESRSESMDAQAIHLYQRNPNEQGPNSPQAPNNGSNGNRNGNNGGPPRFTGSALIVRSLIIIGVILLGWYLFQYFFNSSSSSTSTNVIEIPI